MPIAIFYTLVVLLGILSMGFQLLASRLLNPFFGSSLIVWAWLISTFLAAFSVGSILGGWISNAPAPQRVRAQWMAGAVAVGSLAFTAFFGRAVLGQIELAFAEITTGLLVACLGLFFLPVTTLSSFGPQCVQFLAGRGTPPGKAPYCADALAGAVWCPADYDLVREGWSMQRTAQAEWKGTGKEGSGTLTTPSGALNAQPYSFQLRFVDEDGRNGTNPEELIAAAHAGCFSMALSFQLANAGFTADAINTTAVQTMEPVDGAQTITKIVLQLSATIPGISDEQFQTLAGNAKAGCPVSRLLKAEISLEATLA